MELRENMRIVQELVPGKQITLCHIIANPDDVLYFFVGENDLDIIAKGLVVFNVIDACETVNGFAEGGAEIRLFKAGIGENALFVHQIGVKEQVADLVGGEGELNVKLFAGSRKCLKNSCKAVAAENGENDAHIFAAESCFGVCGDLVDVGVVGLSAGNDCLGNSYDIALFNGKSFIIGGLEKIFGNETDKIISGAEDGHNDTSCCNTGVTHCVFPTFHG